MTFVENETSKRTLKWKSKVQTTDVETNSESPYRLSMAVCIFLRFTFISLSLSFAFSYFSYEKKYILVHTLKDKSKQSAYLCFALKIENKMQTRVRSSQIKYRFKARTVNTMVADSMRLLESRRQLNKLYQCKGSHYVYMNYLWYLNTIFNSTKTWAGTRNREKKRVKLVLMR